MKRSPRRASIKPKSCAIIVYFPQELVHLLDAAAIKTDSDRNKFICAAVQEKLKMKGL
jgi:metal-responsive CopG/Arc/MetJ family transcriptional regulator